MDGFSFSIHGQSDEFHVKTAETIEEACKLAESALTTSPPSTPSRSSAAKIAKR